MHEKLNYEIPEAELLVVRFEESILSGGIEGSEEKNPFDDWENEG